MTARDALRGGDQVDELDPDGLDRAPALEDLDGRRRRAAGREHRIEDEAQVDGRRVGQLVVVLDRPKRAFIAEQAEVPDLGGGHQLEHRVDHAEAGAQDRDQADALAELVAVHRLEGRPDRQRPDPGIGEGLVAEQPGQLPDDLAELLRLGLPSRRMASLWRTAGWLETWSVGGRSVTDPSLASVRGGSRGAAIGRGHSGHRSVLRPSPGPR